MSAPTRRPRQLRRSARTAPTESLRIRASPRRSSVVNSSPRYITQFATLCSAGPISGVKPRPASTEGRHDHHRRALDEQIGYLDRFERRVDGADDVEQRLVPLDAAPQLTLKHAEA